MNYTTSKARRRAGLPASVIIGAIAHGIWLDEGRGLVQRRGRCGHGVFRLASMDELGHYAVLPGLPRCCCCACCRSTGVEGLGGHVTQLGVEIDFQIDLAGLHNFVGDGVAALAWQGDILDAWQLLRILHPVENGHHALFELIYVTHQLRGSRQQLDGERQVGALVGAVEDTDGATVERLVRVGSGLPVLIVRHISRNAGARRLRL
eukprot:scaffold1637_cov410-Prasinococcus_capsulatus_cf.AAC.40